MGHSVEDAGNSDLGNRVDVGSARHRVAHQRPADSLSNRYLRDSGLRAPRPGISWSRSHIAGAAGVNVSVRRVLRGANIDVVALGNWRCVYGSNRGQRNDTVHGATASQA